MRRDEQKRKKEKKGEQAQEGGVGTQRPPLAAPRAFSPSPEDEEELWGTGRL